MPFTSASRAANQVRPEDGDSKPHFPPFRVPVKPCHHLHPSKGVYVKRHQVAVIGAGPAALSTAVALANAGVDTALIGPEGGNARDTRSQEASTPSRASRCREGSNSAVVRV
ncbi:MAG: FAD-dependent monooxygenase, partial [Pseudomonadota bacterium]